jgi:plastocyanin
MDRIRPDPPSEAGGSPRHDPRARGAILAMLGAAALLAAAIAPVTSATVDGTWRAKMGTGGANGAVTVVALVGGGGTATLRLKSVPPSAAITSVLRAGTCARPTAVVATLPSTRSSSTGKLNLTKALTASAVTRLLSASSLVVTIRSGGFTRCAKLARVAAPSTTPSPSPTGDSAATEVRATGFAFSPASLTVSADVPLAVEFRNDDAGVPHGFSVGASAVSTPLFTAPTITGVARETFTIPGLPAGTYVFYCPIHKSMTGVLTVSAVGAVATPSPTASAAATSSPVATPMGPPPPTPGPPPSYPPYP